MGTDSGWRDQWLGPKENFSKHLLPTRNLGKGREGPLSLDQTPPAWEEMGKRGRPGRREEPQREEDGLFLLVILGRSLASSGLPCNLSVSQAEEPAWSSRPRVHGMPSLALEVPVPFESSCSTRVWRRASPAGALL